MGEVVKYALIGDVKLFEFITENFSNISPTNFKVNEMLVSVSAQQKAIIVEKDEKEQGIRATLNFGHTFGHTLEKFFNYKKVGSG